MFGTRTSLAVLICALLCLTAGCTTLFSDEVTEDELLSKIDAAEPPEEMSTTIEVNTSTDNTTYELSYQAWYRLDGTSRTEGTLDGERIIQVNDGEQAWIYNPGQDSVQVREVTTETSALAESINTTRELIQSGNVTEIRETEYEGRDVYHVIFDSSGAIEKYEDGGGFLPPIAPGVGGILGGGNTDQKGNGSSPLGQRFDADRVELWIDAEYMVILRQKTVGENPFDMRYTDVEFNPGLDDALFEFEPPENATVEELETPKYREFGSVEAAQEAAPFDITKPAVERWELDSTFVVTREGSDEAEIGLQYDTGGPFGLTVTKRNRIQETDWDGESVSIGEGTGTYMDMNDNLHRVRWVADGFEYSILASQEIDRETLVDLAESMDTT
jgi:outer membrane lipoprotein-sorting protein